MAIMENLEDFQEECVRKKSSTAFHQISPRLLKHPKATFAFISHDDVCGQAAININQKVLSSDDFDGQSHSASSPLRFWL
jgi:hypothetical protein